jgi:hypothetical protein
MEFRKEGDIYLVKSPTGLSLGKGAPWKEVYRTVEYKIGSMGDTCGYFLCTPRPEYVEVVGNLYENPDLIK